MQKWFHDYCFVCFVVVFFILESGLLFVNAHFGSYLHLSPLQWFPSLALTLTCFLTATLHPPPPSPHTSRTRAPPHPPLSEDKLWLGPDIPSNLLSQHRVKRARVLSEKAPLYAPRGDMAHHTSRLPCWESLFCCCCLKRKSVNRW